MKQPTPSKRSRTTAKEEAQQLFQTLGKLVDCLLNKAFALTQKAANRRASLLTVLLLLAGLLFSLNAFPLNQWTDHLRNFFVAIFNSDNLKAGVQDPISALPVFAVQALISPKTLRYLPLLWLPYYLALHLAAIYLDDIFELNQVDTARQFILRAALGNTYATLRIKQGDIAEEHRDSPIYKIGGPGKVLVELDSVALFEHPDGRPHIIGPTGDKPSGVETLEGFERFRQAIYLPDHFPESLQVSERSSDGIMVEAKDVRLVFSIWRGEGAANRQPKSVRPYPFDEQAVKNIVYKETRQVRKEKTKQSGSDREKAWSDSVKALIRSELGKFISNNKLSEYLASISDPEVENVNLLREQIKTDEKAEMFKKPAFHPRPEITSLFQTFAENFTKQAKDRGIELHWIGVGTWHTPEQIVPQRHLEAWRLSRENLAAKSDGALEALKEQAGYQAVVEQVSELPLEAYRSAVQNALQYKETQNFLLRHYRGHLVDLRDKLKEKGEIPPEWLETVIKHLDSLLLHWVRPMDDDSMPVADG